MNDIDFEQLHQKICSIAQEYDCQDGWLTASQIHNIFMGIFIGRNDPKWRSLWEIVDVMIDLGMMERGDAFIHHHQSKIQVDLYRVL